MADQEYVVSLKLETQLLEIDNLTDKISEFKRVIKDLSKHKIVDKQSVQYMKDQVTSLKKQRIALRENVRNMRRFKSEWLSILFLAQMVLQPFTNLVSQVLKMTGVFDVFNAVLTALLLPILMPLVETIIELAMWLNKQDPFVKKLIAGFIIFAAILGAVIPVIATVMMAIGASAFGAVAAVVAIVAAVISFAVVFWDSFKKVFEILGGIFAAFIGILLAGWLSWVNGIKALWDNVVAFFNGDISLVDAIKNIIAAITAPFAAWFIWLSEKWNALWNGFRNSNIGEWFAGLFNFSDKKQFGGNIKESGMYYLHAGEQVSSNSPQGFQSNETSNNITINANISNDMDIDWIARQLSRKLNV